MSVVRRKPVPAEGSTWATPGTAKHAKPASSRTDAAHPVSLVAATGGSHRSSAPPAAPTQPAADGV